MTPEDICDVEITSTFDSGLNKILFFNSETQSYQVTQATSLSTLGLNSDGVIRQATRYSIEVDISVKSPYTSMTPVTEKFEWTFRVVNPCSREDFINIVSPGLADQEYIVYDTR